jgi:protein involved in polysaccharide export with SLBB domain
MSKQRIAQVAFLSIVGIILFAVIYAILKRPEPSSPPLVITLQPRPTAEPATPTPATITIYVSGAVKRPDVYTLPLNSNVKDAITAAGGATAEADLDRINLASHVRSMQVYVPRKGEAAPPPPMDQPDAPRRSISTPLQRKNSTNCPASAHRLPKPSSIIAPRMVRSNRSRTSTT